MTCVAVVLNVMLAWLLLFINGRMGKWKQRTSNLFSYSTFGFGDITEDEFSDNFFQLLIHPAIYLAIVGSILQAFSCETIVRSLWLLVPLYWGLRFAVMIARDTFCFQNWWVQITLLFASLLLSEGTYFLIIRLLDEEKTVFIDVAQFRDAFWFAVLCFIAKFVWDYFKRKMIGDVVFPPQKKANVILRRYDKYQRKYNEIIETSLDRNCVFKSRTQRMRFCCLIYAIMVYEDHNRPAWFRLMEYAIKMLCPRRLMSLGIMQIQTNRLISSRASIQLAIRKLYKTFSSVAGSTAIEEAIGDYNPDSLYLNEVRAIYDEIAHYLELPQYDRQIVKVKKRSYARR